MSFELWASFVAVYFAITIVPGPSVFVITNQALTLGGRAAFRCVLGDVLGDACLLTISLIGLGIILQQSETAFLAIKWAGVVYVVGLGLCQVATACRAKPNVTEPRTTSKSGILGFFTGVSNPKAIVFYAAFLPQFLQDDQAPGPQLLILVVSAIVIGVISLSGYAIVAVHGARFFQGVRMQRYLGALSGAGLIAVSAFMVTTR